MRPTGIESIRGIQVALTEAIAPELQTAFAQDVAQTVQMLLESLANEWDTAVEDLHHDNGVLRDLISQALVAMRSLPEGNDRLDSVVKEMEGALAQPSTESLVISELTAENDRWRGILERTLVALEGASLEPALEALMRVREAVYAHLREAAARGWSFWDVMSFRERMARLRAGDPR